MKKKDLLYCRGYGGHKGPGFPRSRLAVQSFVRLKNVTPRDVGPRPDCRGSSRAAYTKFSKKPKLVMDQVAAVWAWQFPAWSIPT